MKRIALISITINSVKPMTDYLLSKPDIAVINYLDGYLSEKIEKEGGITDETMGRMLHLLAAACRDGADGVILTCTVFSPYADMFQKLFSVPVIGADTAMFDQVGKIGGSTALLCTFESTLTPSKRQLSEQYLKYNKKEQIEIVWLKEAYEAIQQQNLKKHNDLIIKQVQQMDGSYDNIVLAQISMAGAANGLMLNKSRLFTSPQAAYEQLLELMK
ncbi:MAG: aspartate/glutamate racemase family protein [Lacrimispora sp.]|uniref:aspartate/glutamate racemase family protein n=1 Tax=Lacrimispora sp. TaxID=2719234 RepID=UPI0039E6CCA7